MTVSIIVAVAADGAIGRGGDQPFYIKEDLRRFKQLTTGHPIIMGRRTYEALPKGALPNRRNIVVTRNADFRAEGVETAATLEEAISLGAATDDEVFIIGGGRVYAQAIDLADRIYLTLIDAAVPDADTFFPAIDPAIWTVTNTTPTLSDPASPLTYRFQTLTRR